MADRRWAVKLAAQQKTMPAHGKPTGHFFKPFTWGSP
jgi:hypothetical protein